LLLSTVSVVPIDVYEIMLGNTAGICAAIILTTKYPVYGTISMLTFYASTRVLFFFI
jgi:hypothetical protein